MNCQGCGYRLWNLTSRTCPECGKGFRPSDFEFRPNAVQYCCPDCEQTYYGTSEIGHLVPPEFDCVTCGKHLHMDEMVLRPADWSREDLTAAGRNPWLDRVKRGRVGAWFSTIGMGMVKPGRLLRDTPADGSNTQAWWYLMLSYFVYCTIGLGSMVLIFGLLMFQVLKSSGAPGMGLGMGMIAGAFLFVMIALPLLAALAVVIWGASAHLVLMGGKPAHGIGRTYQAMCYSSGPMVLLGVPCLGYYLSTISQIWWLVSAILALRSGQKVHGGRATLAVLWLPVVAFVGVIVFAVLNTPDTTSMSGPEIYSINSALTASTYGSQGPAHALMLADLPGVSDDDFVGTFTQTMEWDVPLASGQTLDDFMLAPHSQRQQMIQAAAAALPPNVSAHRLGDFVFTYHGIDLSQGDPDLWVCIFSPQPSVNPHPGPQDWVQVVERDGNVTRFSYSMLPQLLASQNALRAQHGLPPLPDPRTVTHQNPAVGP